VKAEAVRARFSDRRVEWEVSRAFSDAIEDEPLWSLVGEPWLVVGPATRPQGLPATIRVVDWEAPAAGVQ